MASKSSKSLPFLVLIAAMTLAAVEIQTGREAPIDDLMPLFIAVGVTGAPLAAAKKFAEVLPAMRRVTQSVAAPPPRS